ncbi:MAG TPA: OsmC family protein [Candidatus Aminicenantes bacterium]|nr:OsmC family protein [Candidatus Aminicenantes bacterium]HRY63878.1 OsmC family protein [Candidatus Aminicenantes bacterium]HRZ70791.1 OsmC family protein [Candidatus Aminicenantes bacterium]
MAEEIRADAVFKEGMRFDGVSGRAGTVAPIDFAADGQSLGGFAPLELLLASLAGCSGQVVVGLLKRMGQEVGGLTVRARGAKKEIHPKVLVSIELEFEFRGGRLDGASVEKALALSEERFCPVWAMLKGGTPIKATYRLVAG